MQNELRKIFEELERIQNEYNQNSITIQEVVNSKFFEGYKILGGEEGLDNLCNHMAVLDTPEGLDWAKGGEFILTAGYIFSYNKELKDNLVKNAHKMGVGAIAIKDNRYFGDIDVGLINDANFYKMPLILVPKEFTYTIVISNFYEMLFKKKNEYILNINKLYEKILMILFGNKDLKGTIDSLASISNSNITLLDSRGEILVQSIFNKDIYKATTNQIQLKKIEEFPILNDNICVINEMIGGAYLSIHPIFKDSIIENYICIITEDEVDSLFQNIFEIAKSIISLNVRNEWMIKVNRNNFIKILVETMLHSENLSSNFYASVEKDLGWDRIGEYVGVCINSNEGDHENERIMNSDIYDVIYGVLGSNNFLTTERNNHIFLILKMEKTMYLDELMNRVKRIIEEYNESLEISIGISNTYDSLEDIKNLYNESFLASMMTNKNINYYKKFSTIKLLYPLREDKEVLRYYESTIMKLKDYDKKNGSNLLETLRCFFDNNLNKTTTSSKLFIHIETLRYRLNRIEEITNFDVNEVEGLFTLHMGLKLEKLIKLQ